MALGRLYPMKPIFLQRTLWVLFAGVAAFVAALMNIDALTYAIQAGDWAGMGDLLGTIIVLKWNAEVAKLLFWIHLLS